MRKSKILATVAAILMLCTLVTGCLTTKNESDSLEKVESQVEQDVLASSIDESTSEDAESADLREQSAETEEAEYVPNPDNYTVYVINTQRIDDPAVLKSLGNAANQEVIQRGLAVTLYVLDLELLPGETADKIDSIKIIDKQTGSEITDILGNYLSSWRGNACFSDFDYNDVTGEDLCILYTIDNYDISDMQFMIRTNGSVDYDDDSAGWFEVTNIVEGYDKQPRYYADNVIMNINGSVYQKTSSVGLKQDSDNNIEYQVDLLIDLTHIGEPQVPGLTADDIVFLDKETLEPVEIPANAEFAYHEEVDGSAVKLCFGFKMTDSFTDDDMDEFMDGVIPAAKLDDASYMPFDYTHNFLGF